jgi:hypothetical protein
MTLSRTEPSEARLSVAADGWGRPRDRAYRCQCITSDLAALLETEFTYRPNEVRGIFEEIDFPVRPLTGGERLGALLSHAG